MTAPGDLSRWLSLGSYEVLAADFVSDGEPWDRVFPGAFTEPVPEWLRSELPDLGWREVTVREGDVPQRALQLFASPVTGGWVTALVWPQPEGPPIFMGDLSTYPLSPTQEIRRQGLTLSWTEPLRVAASELGAVTVTLTNTSDWVWTPDPSDHAFVHAHLLDDGAQGPAHCSFAYGSSPGDWKGTGVSLAPGESMELPVKFSHDNRPRPGSYGIEAILATLNLRSPRGMLEVVDDTDERPRMTFSEAQNAERLVQEDYERALEKLLPENPTSS